MRNSSRIILALVVIMTLLTTFAIIPANAASVTALSGSGTEADPYKIGTVEDLIFFRDSVNAGETTYNAEGVYVALTANIDMAGIDWSVNIGDDCNATFDGIFDGKDYTISNLTATETAAKGDGYVCAGLFGAIYGSAQVKNLTVKNVNINTAAFVGNNVGAVVGFVYAATGRIENVHVTGDVILNGAEISGIGAIVGYAYEGSLTIDNCSVDVNDGSYINGGAYAGGIIGYAGGTTDVNASTVNNLDVTARACVGGVAGIMLNGSSATANTVRDVAVTATHENWLNSAAVVAGSLSGNITVTDTVIENVTKNGSATTVTVGSEWANKPTEPVKAVIALVDGVYYYDLQEAVAAADGKTVTLVNDVTLEDTLVVPAGTEVTLDLAGYTISQSKACTAHYQMIKNNGSLTITGNGKISFTDTGAGDSNFGWGSYTIANHGVLVVENGTIENLSSQNLGNGVVHMYCAIQQGSGATSTTINGGTISTPTYRSVRVNVGALTINGGNFVGQVWLQPNQGNATITITGGSFAPAGVDGSSVFLTNAGENYTVSSASVSGGYFATKIGASNPSALAGAITGGTFSEAAVNGTNSALLGSNLEFKADENGNYTVKKSVDLPEAEVTPIENPELTFALNFKVKGWESFTDEYIEKLFEVYGHYYVDYVLTIEGLTDTEAVFNSDGNADGYLGGQYDAWSENWVYVPFENTTIANGGSLYIMETAAEMMGKTGLRYTLQEIAEVVKDFDCGIFFTNEFLANNPDMVVTLELVVFTEDADGNIVDRNSLGTNVFTVTDAVELPEAEVTPIENPELTFALNFAIKDMDSFTDEYIEKLFAVYGHYYVDYVLTIEGLTDTEVIFNSDGKADGYLGGQYDAWSENWVYVPFENTSIANGGSLYIMETAAEMMGKTGLRYTLQEIAEIVVNFDCGIFFTDEFLYANPDMVVTLELVVFNEDAEGNIDERYSLATNVFTALDAVELPEAEVTDITDTVTDPELTFALNFKIKDLDTLTDEYIAAVLKKYGKYYVDYVLTIEGLTDTEAIFNANGGADGFLAGQYDAWSENWVSVPFENTSIANNGSLYIMETAAKMMGKTGLRYTLEEIVTVVVDFDCGIFFEPAFLDANPDMVVTLELVVFNEDADGNINERYSLGTNVFTVADSDFKGAVATVNGDKYYYIDEALEALGEGDILTLLQDVELPAQVVLNKVVTIDLNGFTATVADSTDAAFVAAKGFIMVALEADKYAVIPVSHIGENGNWWVGNEDTGVKAEGTDGAGIKETIVEDLKDDDGNVIGHKVTITYTDDREPTVIEILDGKDGKDAITPEFKVEDGILYITYDVDKADADKVWVELGNVKGDKGDKGETGADGTPGQNGTNGTDGKDGLGVKSVEINAEGHLIITYTDDTTKDLGNVMGTDGTNGTNGSNGTNGTDGVDGKTPTFKLEENGDIYLRYDESEEWTLLGNIMGQTGAPGENGADGEDGKDGEGRFDNIVIILISTISVVAIGLSTVAIIMVTRYNYKPWWMI